MNARVSALPHGRRVARRLFGLRRKGWDRAGSDGTGMRWAWAWGRDGMGMGWDHGVGRELVSPSPFRWVGEVIHVRAIWTAEHDSTPHVRAAYTTAGSTCSTWVAAVCVGGAPRRATPCHLPLVIKNRTQRGASMGARRAQPHTCAGAVAPLVLTRASRCLTDLRPVISCILTPHPCQR